jgi:DNA polymerase I-like protein with 3'-5' exonuclease and polymerase domains
LCSKYGFAVGDIKLLGCSTPLPKKIQKSASKKWKHVEQHKDKVLDVLGDLKPQVVVTFGELATRVMTGRPTKITKVRGIPRKENDIKIFPMLSPEFVRRIPENQDIFEADLQFLKSYMDNLYEYEEPEVRYIWVDNIGDAGGHRLRLNVPKVISVDTETQGGTRWWDKDVKLLSVQICISHGESYVLPVCDDWCGYGHGQWHNMSGRMLDRKGNRQLVKEILEDPKIKKVGFNIKFEHLMLKHKLGIEVKGWLHDAQLMLFNVNENLMDKSLETGVRIYVPEISGYESSIVDYDKANMAAIPKNKFVQYAAGDADATLRLAQRLKPILDKDRRQRNLYRKVQLPAILEFAETVEPHGIKVDTTKLEEFGKDLDKYLETTYKKLIKYTPAEIKQEHLDNKKELKFSRADFIRDILFTEKGFNLTPVAFTETTEDLEDEDKVASTSSKKHFPYFVNETQIIEDGYTVGDYVTDLINYQKTQKLNTTYSGDKEEKTGLWQYLDEDNRVHPSYMLHRTNTARTASSDPNGQNWPVRGDWAKKFDGIFITDDGFVPVSCDLSQIELRLAAWMACEPTMLQIYQEGGDIHCKTASSVMGVSLGEFMTWKELDKDKFDLNRYNAKATNFGFIYGLGARGFRVYAKTDYGIDYSEEECWDIRNSYFNTYYGLPIWHNTMKSFARKNGYVRSLLGRVRHLPGIYSEDQGIRAMCERQAINSPIQGMASELGTIALTRFCQQAPKEVIRVNAFIHDDIRCEVREDVAEEAASALKWTVENPPWDWFNLDCPVPIIGDVKINKEERPDIKAIKPYWWKNT